MKPIKTIIAIVLTFNLVCCQSQKIVADKSKVEKRESKYVEGKMVNGTYFLINANQGLAMQPYQKLYGSINNVVLEKLDNSIMQKWVFKENIDGKTKKPNGTLSIYLFVDESQAITCKWGNPLLAKTKEYPKDSFVMEYNENEKAYNLKSTAAKGFYMTIKNGSFAKYMANDGSNVFLWKLLKTN